MRRIWLDDLRKAPPGWQHVWTAQEAIDACRCENVDELSLDYDLDAVLREPHPGNGGMVSKWLLDQAQVGNWGRVPNVIRFHSSNYEGVGEMAWHVAEIERIKWALAMGVPPEAAW